MSSPTIGSTVTAGVQNIGALLPLLGTEQCEQHVGSALTDGFLYAAATPMSIFGSLGMASAGFKALAASISIPRWRYVGAEKLRNTGFVPSGKNLALIMMDPDQAGCYLAETRLDSLLDALHVENVENLRVKTIGWTWNLKLVFTTAFLCLMSMAPYIQLDLARNRVPHFNRWAFPVVRVLGGFLTTTSLQIIIQQRLTTLLNKRILFHTLDSRVKLLIRNISIQSGCEGLQWDPHKSSETCLWSLKRVIRSTQQYERSNRVLGRGFIDGGRELWKVVYGGFTNGQSRNDSKKNIKLTDQVFSKIQNEDKVTDVESGDCAQQPSQLADLEKMLNDSPSVLGALWFYLLLMSLGIIASVVGYIGSFSVVQGGGSPSRALVWLSLEAILSIIRMALWSWNPVSDDPDPIKLLLKLNDHPPLSTCSSSEDEIRNTQVLPLVRAPEFLRAITSYAGLLKRFRDPDLSLFYTLTRKSAHAPGIHQQVLYITIFDHKERTVRIYHEDDRDNVTFWSADNLTVDIQHGILQTKIKARIDPANDHIASDNSLRSALHLHYRSILDQILFRGRNPQSSAGGEALESPWTLKIADTSSALGRDAEISQDVKKRLGIPADQDDIVYFRQGDIQRKKRSLFKIRQDWVEHYMAQVKVQMQTTLEETKSKVQMTEPEVMILTNLCEWMLMYERLEMEQVLGDEMQQWEESLLDEYQKMIEMITERRKSDLGLEDLKIRLKRDWLANSWTRLNTSNAALEKLAKETTPGRPEIMDDIWQDTISNLQNWWQELAHTYADEEYFALSPPERSEIREPMSRVIRVKLTTIDRQIRTILESDLLIGTDNRAEILCRLWERERKGRIQNEIKDMKDRLGRGLAYCDNFGTSPTIAKVILSKSKWAEIPAWGIYDHSEGFTRALQRNDKVIYAQFNATFDARAISMVQNVASLTTLSFTSKGAIGERTLTALQDAVLYNSNITAICGDNPQLESLRATLAYRSHCPNKFTHISAQGFLLSSDGSTLRGGSSSRIELRFVGPMKGGLLLRLKHSSETEQVLNINSRVPLSYNVSGSSTFTITLSPDSHFGPGTLNLLSVVPSVDGYRLFDIDLLDEHENPYRDPDDMSIKHDLKPSFVDGTTV